jgi:hypothetical protein
MGDPESDRPASPASRRTTGAEDQDSIRQARQRSDHEDRHHGPHQEVPAGGSGAESRSDASPRGSSAGIHFRGEPPDEAPQVPDFQIESQPIVNGRQPARPGQPGRWEDQPGDRDAARTERPPEQRPHGQHEKA